MEYTFMFLCLRDNDNLSDLASALHEPVSVHDLVQRKNVRYRGLESPVQ